MVDGKRQQKFLGSVDFLSQHGMPTLISDMEAATQEVLKGKQLTSLFNNTTLQETITQMLNTFMSRGSPFFWVKYMISEDARLRFTNSGNYDIVPFYMTDFEQLMMEANAVLSSAEFGSVIDISLKAVVDTLAKQIVLDAKTVYPAGCNAMETLLVHKDLAEKGWIINIIVDLRTEGITIYEGPKASSLLAIPLARSLHHEFLFVGLHCGNR